MTVNFKNRWKEVKRKKLNEEKVNPYAVCHDNPDVHKQGGEFEKCVKQVKKQNEEDELIEPTDQVEPDIDSNEIIEPELDSTEELETKDDLSTLDSSDIVQADLEGGPEVGEEPVVEPENSINDEEELQIAEAYAKKIDSLNKKKTKIEEELNSLIQEIEKNKKMGQKKFQYEEAKNNVSQLKEELEEIKNDDMKKENEEKMNEEKKNKKDMTSLNKATGTKSGTDPIGKYGKTDIKTKKDKDRDPKNRRRKDKQKGYDKLDESKHKYLKEAYNYVNKSKNNEEGGFTFHIG